MNSSNLSINVVDFDQERFSLRTDGYRFMRSGEWYIHSSIYRYWNILAESWNDLEVDTYMKNGAAFRQRRFGHFIYHEENDLIQPTERTNFFQEGAINSYSGGINRIFSPMHRLIYQNRFLHHIIECSLENFRLAFGTHAKEWDVTVHQFRILASEGMQGQPTPEGIHRDGHKFISMHLIRRENIEGGVSRLYDSDGNKMAQYKLVRPMDTLLVADEILMHDVTPISPLDPSRPAYRDMLVIDYNIRS